MFVGTAIAVFFRQTEIYNIYEIPLLPQAHQKVIWLDVPVDKIAAMSIIRSTYLWESEYKQIFYDLLSYFHMLDYIQKKKEEKQIDRKKCYAKQKIDI